MSAFFVFRSRRTALTGIIFPILFGAVLSCCIEMLQIYVPTRHCSAIDVITNVTGSTLGVLAAILFVELAGDNLTGTLLARCTDRTALTLLFLAAADLTAPFFPIMGRTALWAKFIFFLHSPFTVLPAVSYAAFWLACGLLLRAANLEPARLWLTLSLVAIPCQIAVTSRQPTLSDIAGAIAGLLLFLAIGKQQRLAAAFFLTVLIVRGLAPFHFQQQAAYFTWIPFGGFLNMDWQTGLSVFIEKLFFYGSAIWLLQISGLSLAASTAATATLLAGIEVAQQWLPGRTAEITDPLIALLIGLAMHVKQKPAASLPDSWPPRFPAIPSLPFPATHSPCTPTSGESPQSAGSPD